MKKVTTFICSLLVFVFVNQSASFAYSSNNINSKSSDEENLKVTEELKNQLLNSSVIINKAPNSSSEISIMAHPSDNPDSRQLTGVVRKAYSNNGVKVLVTGLYNFLASKIPEAAKKNYLYYAINSFVSTQIISNIKPHYYEAWLWETHDWDAGVHRVYVTVKSYTDSSYTKVSGVTYNQVDYYPIYKNGVHYHKY